ncbi:hypothetical protein JXA85_03160 [Candidatus Woesearchaeota archaeon]|nr:hypothetical protein [Candidatus Woesearchaeota archaeon]
MNITLIVLGIAGMLALLVVIQLIRGAFRIISSVIFLLFLAMMTMSILIVYDAYQMKKSLPGSSNIFMIKDGDMLQGGFEGKLGDALEIVFFDRNAVEEYQEYYSAGDMKSILETDYKLFIFDMKAFDELNWPLDTGQDDISKELMFEIMRSNEPLKIYVDAIYPDSEAGSEAIRKSILSGLSIEDEYNIKGVFLNMLFAKAMDEKDAVFILEEYRAGNLIIYPETIVFKFVKSVPTGLYKKATQLKKKVINK